MILRCQMPGGYRSSVLAPWSEGEEREVQADVAEYLLSSFPGSFVPAARGEAMAAPPSDRAMRSPKRR